MIRNLGFILLCSFFILSFQSANSQKDVFLRKIDFELSKLSPVPEENEFFLTLQLNKGTKYKYVVTNNVNGMDNQAIVEVLDEGKLILTNSLSGKYFEQFMFLCNKTSFYDIVIKFKDKKQGSTEVKIFMVQ